MKKHIETPTVGEILFEEFMKPFGISSYRLAKDIDVPISRIQDILHDRRRMTADTSVRLAKYFGLSERYFIDIQTDIEVREAKVKSITAIEGIVPFREVAYSKL